LTSLQLIVPIVAVAEGSYFLHEAVPWTMLLGTAIVLGSVAFVMRSRSVEGRKPAFKLQDSGD
jgi:drug/metabolite transporter (DMT)-like permease